VFCYTLIDTNANKHKCDYYKETDVYCQRGSENYVYCPQKHSYFDINNGPY